MIGDNENEARIEKQFTQIRHKQTYNPGHNILAHFNNLAQVRIATRKTILDIQHNKLATQVALRVAERLKIYDLRKSGNIRNMSNLGGDGAQCPVFLPQIKL